jgi:hypothetical protein
MKPIQNLNTIAELEHTLRQQTNKSAVDQALLDYQKWEEHLETPTSDLNHRLYFLKAVEQRSGDSTLKNHREVIETIIKEEDIPSLGTVKYIDGETFFLLNRKIDNKYDIELEFRDKNGLILRNTNNVSLS